MLSTSVAMYTIYYILVHLVNRHRHRQQIAVALRASATPHKEKATEKKVTFQKKVTFKLAGTK